MEPLHGKRFTLSQRTTSDSGDATRSGRSSSSSSSSPLHAHEKDPGKYAETVFQFHGARNCLPDLALQTALPVEKAVHFAVTESAHNLLLVFPLARYGLAGLPTARGLRLQVSPVTNRCPRQLHLQFFGTVAEGAAPPPGSSPPQKRFVFERVVPRDVALPQQITYFEKQDCLVVVIRKHAPEIWGMGDHSTRGVGTTLVEDEEGTLSTLTEEGGAEMEAAAGADGAAGAGKVKEKGPVMFIRSDEGEVTMGHAVLLTNRLFYELM